MTTSSTVTGRRPAAESVESARRSCATARAWHLGTHLAHLLAKHDVPRPARVSTWNVAKPDEGQTILNVQAAVPADLFLLAYRAGARLYAAEAGAGGARAQAYTHFGEAPSMITVHWAGVTTSAAAS